MELNSELERLKKEIDNYKKLLIERPFKINGIAQKIHQAAMEKVFWDKPRETGTLLMLCVVCS